MRKLPELIKFTIDKTIWLSPFNGKSLYTVREP